MSTSTLILIPARLAATRLPNKPLADIGGLPMVVRVMQQGEKAGIGRVVVACAEEEIAEAVKQHGGEAVLTDPNHPSGSDRIYEALQKLDPERKVQHIINLQGDMPFIDPLAIVETHHLLLEQKADMATCAARIEEDHKRENPNVVKAIIAFRADGKSGRALYFTRATAPSGLGDLYEHIGIYAYTRPALERFISLPPSPLEKRERLEQLRAVEQGMHMEVGIVNIVPQSVDTAEDLERARASAIKGVHA